MARWECIVCGLIYDEREGWPDDGIAPGTRWEDVPDDWTCPDCGVGKDDFELVAGSEDDPVATDAPEDAQSSTPTIDTATITATSSEGISHLRYDQNFGRSCPKPPV
jgi:Rubredoxin